MTIERDTGKGPFSYDAGISVVVINDARGEQFCLVQAADCAGGDASAAKARAARICEALNRADETQGQ